MKKKILILVAIILAAVLIGEFIYITYRKNSQQPQQPGESTDGGVNQSTDEPGTSQATAEGEGSAQPGVTQSGSETEDTKPSGTTEPAESTGSKETTDPVETTAPADTAPEETPKETGSGVSDEDDLPPQRI